MLTLYFAPHTCALSVLIVLKWLDVPHKVEKVKLGDPAYQKTRTAWHGADDDG